MTVLSYNFFCPASLASLLPTSTATAASQRRPQPHQGQPAAAAATRVRPAPAARAPSVITDAEFQVSCTKIAEQFAFLSQPAAARSEAEFRFTLVAMRMVTDIARVFEARRFRERQRPVAATNGTIANELQIHMAHLLAKNAFKAELQGSPTLPDDPLFPPSALCETVHFALCHTEFLRSKPHLTSLDQFVLVTTVLDGASAMLDGPAYLLHSLLQTGPGPLLFLLMRLDDFSDLDADAALRQEAIVSGLQDVKGRLGDAEKFGVTRLFEPTDGSAAVLFTLPVRNSDAGFLVKIEWLSLEQHKQTGQWTERNGRSSERRQRSHGSRPFAGLDISAAHEPASACSFVLVFVFRLESTAPRTAARAAATLVSAINSHGQLISHSPWVR